MKTRSDGGLYLLVIGLVLCGAGLWLLLSPPIYRATVKFQVEPDQIIDNSSAPYGGYFIETEFKIIYSDRVLSNVVQSLDLGVKWGKRYGKGANTDANIAIALLKHRMSINAENGKTIDVAVMDEDPDEAAQIANAIPDAYRDYRIALHQQQMINGLKMLEKDYQDEEIKIKAMRTQVEQLGKQTNQANVTVYLKAKKALDDEETFHKLFEAKIESLKGETNGSPISPVVITEPAVPPKNPIGPGPLYGTFLLACGVVLSGIGVYLRLGGSRTSAIPSNRT